MVAPITRESVLDSGDFLPAFPLVVRDILASLDDPDANLNLVVEHVRRDPGLVARVYSQANILATRTSRAGKVNDLYTATSLIGLARLRQTVVMASLGSFINLVLPLNALLRFWQHSAAVAISAQQLALHTQRPVEAAMVAGVLHDVGQIWLLRTDAESFMAAWQETATQSISIEEAEKRRFGVDHATIGGWLAEGWGLPSPVADAIAHHHDPGTGQIAPVTALVHVSEVLSHALDLCSEERARVTYLSAECCQVLGLSWDERMNALFGRIEAMSHFAAHYYGKD